MRGERGFTLVEIMVALTLSAMVLVLAHRVLAGIVDGSARLATVRTNLDREMNARRWLTEAFGSLDAPFAGRQQQVEFSTAQLVSSGWLEPRRVLLGRSGDSLVASLDGEGRVVLARGVSSVAFDYLLDPGAEAKWVREWISPVSAPLAVRIRIAKSRGVIDTLLLFVGPRG
jgi:prepilin-type N-terminal cleavage/methylation domain-containing protein